VSSKNLVTDRRLWLTADRDQVVEDGDPAAAFLLVAGAGRTISADAVSGLELQVVDGRLAYPGSPDFEEAEEAEGEAEEVEAEAAGVVLRFGEGQGAGNSDRNIEVPDWPGRRSPEAYLRQYPTGPKAELAAAVIAARDDGAGGGS
jgi:hypothetical protein